MDETGRAATTLPKTIGRYQIQGSLGTGAMGAVYKGFDPLIKRTLAIKTIRLDIARQSDEYKMFLERFYQEARISGTLSHPNIVTLFDIGEDSGVPFLALEFIEGETIESMLERGVKFRPEKVIGLVSQVASALDYAHSRGVIHRDVKPANLLVFEGDRVKVTDFGIAKLAGSEMTTAGQLLGTPSYMSPEQAMGEKLDGRSDIFSLGVCAFEMLSGEQPFPGNNVTAILYKLVHMDPIEPANLEMNGLIPQKWHEVFGKVLAKRRDDRYQSAADFVRDLEYCLGSWFSGALGGDLLAGSPADFEPAAPAAGPEQGAPRPAPAPAPMPAPSPAARPAAPAAFEEEEPPVTVALPPPAKAAPAPAPPLPADITDMEPIVLDEDELPPTAAFPTPPAEAEGATVVLGAQKAQAPEGATVVLPQSGSPGLPAKPAPPVPAPRPAPTPSLQRTPGTGTKPPRTPGPASRPPAATPVLTAPAAEPVAVQPRAGLPMGLMLASGALLLLALLAVGVVLVRQRTSGPAAPVAASEDVGAARVPAGEGEIQVDTQPAGATISVDGQPRGASPLSVKGLPPGSHQVKAELSGYQARFTTVVIRPGSLQAKLQLTLEPPSNKTGLADILSTPAGAQVTIDGVKQGRTPLRGHKLPTGTRHVEMVTEGHEPWSGNLTVEEGKTARLNTRLEPAGQVRAEPGPVTQPTAPPGAPAAVDTSRVYLSGEEDVVPAKRIGGADVAYPDGAPRLKAGEQPSVLVSWVVSETGDVQDVRIEESLGKLVDDAVIATLKTWKYTPATKRGVRVKFGVSTRFRFRAG
jgi:TonB family protein